MTVAAVPVKGLEDAKSRLLPSLSADARAELCLAMLRDVLEALAAVPEIRRRVVVTPDPAVAERARELGAEVLLEHGRGLNEAVDEAGATLVPEGESFLVVLGDVAGARPHEIRTMLEVGQEVGAPGAVLAPSSDGGTCALLRQPSGAFPGAFGPGSAARHRAVAARLGIPLRVVHLPSLALDLDDAEDLERFLASETGGAHTRALLERLGHRPGARASGP